jgi:hypothetical protein
MGNGRAQERRGERERERAERERERVWYTATDVSCELKSATGEKGGEKVSEKRKARDIGRANGDKKLMSVSS